MKALFFSSHAGIDKCEISNESLLSHVIRRRSFIPKGAYRLLVTSRPSYNTDNFDNKNCFDRRLHIFGFTQTQRERFFEKYVKAVHKQSWNDMNKHCMHLLEAADGFCELVTQLPFIATLLANSLPDMAKLGIPQTRHQFMLQLLKPLVMNDLSEEEQKHFRKGESLFGAKYNEPLKLLGELALADLLSDFPKGGFTPIELEEKLSSRKGLKDDLEKTTANLVATLTEYRHVRTGIANEYQLNRFLDPSIEQLLAAIAFVQEPKCWQFPGHIKHETLETFWLFAAGLCSDIAPSVRRNVFYKMTSCHDSTNLQPGVVETLTIMLEEAFPDLSKKSKATLQEHQDLFHSLSMFLNRHLHFCRRWALLKRPFRSIGHALHLIPDIKSVTLYSLRPPPPDASHGEISAIFDCLINGLKRQYNSLERIELFLAPTVVREDTLAPVSPEFTRKLIEVLQSAWRLDSFGCDWPFSSDDMVAICAQGFATCPSLTEVGLSIRQGELNQAALAAFARMLRDHPNIVSLRLGDVGQHLPGPIFEHLATRKAQVERVVLSLTTPSPEILTTLTDLLRENTSISALAILPSRALYGRSPMLESNLTADDAHRSRIDALAAEMKTRIDRFIVYTPALCLDDDSMLSMITTLLKASPLQRLKQLEIVCDNTISPEGGQRLKELVERYPPLEIVTHRMSDGIAEEPGIYKGRLSEWISRCVFVWKCVCVCLGVWVGECVRER